MTSFWSAWIIILTVVTLVLICWVLFSNRKITKRENQETTGHVYDGIEEYDNPMPAWWINLFIASIVFGVIYLILYPGMGNFAGVLGWTSTKQWQQEVDKADAAKAELYARYSEMSAEELAATPKAMRIAKRVFANNCSVCHGTDAKGSYGFPNLTDDDWLYGGSPEQIKTSLVNGRSGMMPAWEAVLGAEGINQMTAYILQLGNDATPEANIEHAAAAKQYATLCSACHGADGKGNYVFGAPNLSDDIWLYGGDEASIKHSLINGRNGKMPAHAELLSAEKIHLLTAYVYQLSQE